MKDSNILKYDKFSKMLSKIYEYVEKKDYKEAYYKCAALIEFININILIRKFNVKLEDTTVANIMREYSNKDKVLFSKMVDLIDEYSTIDMDVVDVSDIEYLVSEADYILGYATKKYGNLL